MNKIFAPKLFNLLKMGISKEQLIADIFVTLIVQFADIPVTTIESFFGEIPNSFSFSIPNIDLNNLHIYIAPALTIALLGGVESLLSAVVADGMISGNHRSNTELIAQGIANVVSPFFGGIAGILIIVAYNMSEWRSFVSILKASPFDIIVLLSTFLLTVFVDLTVAIEIGVVLSSLLFMKRMADIHIKIQSQVDSDILEDYSDLPEGISIYEISGPLFFASAKQYSEVIKEVGLKSKILIIRMRHVPFVDSTALHNFEAMIQTLQKSDVKVLLSGVNSSVFKDLKKHHITTILGEENILDSFDGALNRARSLNSKPSLANYRAK